MLGAGGAACGDWLLLGGENGRPHRSAGDPAPLKLSRPLLNLKKKNASSETRKTVQQKNFFSLSSLLLCLIVVTPVLRSTSGISNG